MKLLKSLAAKLHFFVETIRDFMFYIYALHNADVN